MLCNKTLLKLQHAYVYGKAPRNGVTVLSLQRMYAECLAKHTLGNAEVALLLALNAMASLCTD